MDGQQLIIIQLHYDRLVHNDSVMHWYRALFIAIETILFAAAFAIYGDDEWADLLRTEVIIGGIGIIGCIVCFSWILICEQRGRVVDAMNDKIRNLINGDKDLEDWFEAGRSRRQSEIARWFFNRISPVGVIVAWVAWIEIIIMSY